MNITNLHYAFITLQQRQPFIPPAALARKQAMETERKKKLEKDIEEELGDDYTLDLKKNYDLPEEEKYDIIPELWEGHNVADYVDPEILAKLDELEKEEEEREKEGYYNVEFSEDDEEMANTRILADEIREKKALMKNDAFMKKSSTKPKVGRQSRKRERSVSRLRGEFRDLGVEIDSDDDLDNARDASIVRHRPGPVKKMRVDSEGRVRSSSRTPRDVSGIREPAVREKVRKIGKKAQTGMARMARKGEGDRTIPNVKPKHLFTGKRKLGKTSRR